jgi:hypothetical protein
MQSIQCALVAKRSRMAASKAKYGCHAQYKPREEVTSEAIYASSRIIVKRLSDPRVHGPSLLPSLER